MMGGAKHESLWQWLAQHRVAHHEFAEAMGKAPATVSNWLHLRGRPDIETLDRMSRWTGIPMQVLADGFIGRSPGRAAALPVLANVTDLRVARTKRGVANKKG